MAKVTESGGSNKRKPIVPGAPGTKMVKQEVPFGGIGKAVAKGAAKVVDKVAGKSAEKSVEKALKNMPKAPAMKKADVKKFDKNVDKLVAKAKSADKAEAKANARGLKAANKPTSKNNASVGSKTSAYVSDSVKNMKPANPNVTRGGSMKSKLNWPESMTKPKGK